jgi:exopolyphosphatase / guanosine-5'-triphosphate,3'-diphosphate pyrophosphatase
MRLGVLDVGSNSAQLQVVEVYPGAPPLPTHAVKEPTLLGESFDEAGAIDRAGADRLVAAVCQATQIVEHFAVDQLYVFATSAVRDATNREELVARIERESGLRPQFLSGEDEAKLIYLAVHRWYGWSAGRLLVLDIGGGSMEIVLGRDARPDLTLSLPLGAGRLTRALLADDPPTRKQVKELRKHVQGALREVADRLQWEGDPSKPVATSKTFKQLARLAGAPAQREGPFVRRTLHIDDLARWIPRLAKRSAAERAELRGISAPRARQILAGAVVAEEAMEAMNVDSVDICPWALREGVMLRHLQMQFDTDGDLPLRPVQQQSAKLANVRPLEHTNKSGASS